MMMMMMMMMDESVQTHPPWRARSLNHPVARQSASSPGAA